MRIWRIKYLDDTICLTTRKRWDLDYSQTFDGRRHAANWEIPELIRVESELNDVLVDLPYFTYLMPRPFSKRIIDILWDLIENDIELLPVGFDEGEYWLVNVTTVLDCLDLEKSDYRTLPSGELIYFNRYEFKAEAIGEHNLFRITSDQMTSPGTTCFVTDAFKERAVENHITGIDFELVWDSEATADEDGMVKDEASIAAADERGFLYPHIAPMPPDVMEEIDVRAAEAAFALGLPGDATPKETACCIDDAVGELLDADIPPDDSRVAQAALSWGSLFGWAVCKAYGWTWRQYGADEEEHIYGIVSPEENFCISPTVYLFRILQRKNNGLGGENDNTVALLFNMLDGQNSRPGPHKMIPIM